VDDFGPLDRQRNRREVNAATALWLGYARSVATTSRPYGGQSRMSCLRFIVAVGSVAALLAGCASYKPAPLSPQESAAAIQARSLDDSRLQKFVAVALSAENRPAPRGESDEHFPWNLTTLTLAAVYYHPSLDIARSKLAEARAAVITARQIPNPSLSFEELSYAPGVPAASAWTVVPLINFLIETAGKRGYRTKEANALIEAARADLATASWQVRGRVRKALLDLWAAQNRLALLHRQLDLQNELVTLLEHRLAAGAVSALDVALERNSRNQSALHTQDVARQVVEAQSELAAALGIPLKALDGIRLSFDAFEKPEQPSPEAAPGMLKDEALLHRSDVQALLAEYAAAESRLALQVANQFPNITLSPGYAYVAGQHQYWLLPATELPIFNQNQGPIAEAKARRDEAAARFIALQTQVIAQIDAGWARYRAVQSALKASEALLADAWEREHRILRSYQAGEVDRPSLLVAEIERLSAEQSRLDTIVQSHQALGDLEDALQHPFFGPALPINSETNPRLARNDGLQEQSLAHR
jgi:cobalt-zinc-cadmium efflux system outer membrane protein